MGTLCNPLALHPRAWHRAQHKVGLQSILVEMTDNGWMGGQTEASCVPASSRSHLQGLRKIWAVPFSDGQDNWFLDVWSRLEVLAASPPALGVIRSPLSLSVEGNRTSEGSPEQQALAREPSVLAQSLAFSFCRQMHSASGTLQNQTGNTQASGPANSELGAACDGEHLRTQAKRKKGAKDVVRGTWNLRKQMSASLCVVRLPSPSLGSEWLALGRLSSEAMITTVLWTLFRDGLCFLFGESQPSGFKWAPNFKIDAWRALATDLIPFIGHQTQTGGLEAALSSFRLSWAPATLLRVRGEDPRPCRGEVKLAEH